MEDLNSSIEGILVHATNNIVQNIVDIETLTGLYYIKEHLETLSLNQVNKEIIFQLNQFIMKNTNFEESCSKDMSYLIFRFLIQSLNDISNEQKYIEEFFDKYLLFENYKNILDSKDLINMLFPQTSFIHYLTFLHQAILKVDFWNLSLLEKQKIIYKFFYLTLGLYERSEDAYKLLHGQLYEIFLHAIESQDDEMVYYLHFPLQFSLNSVSKSQEDFRYFNESIEKKIEKYNKNIFIPKYKIKPIKRKIDKTKTIKVAFLQERLINYSIFKVLFSYLKALAHNQNKKVEFIIFDLNFSEVGCSEIKLQNFVKALGFEFIDCHKELFSNNLPFYSTVEKSIKLRELIIKKEIDVLIGMHSRVEYNFLFTSRTTPRQIYWSHGNNEYDIEGIDERIAHFDVKHDIHTFQVLHQPIDIQRYNPNVDFKEVTKVKAQYPKDAFILGTIGRLVKIDNYEYLSTIARIMKDNPNTIFLACGGGDQESIRKKTIELGINERFYFTGHINAHVYGHIINLFVDPFPMHNGESLSEYISKGYGCVLTLIKYEKPDYINKEIQRLNEDDLATVYIDNLECLSENTLGYRQLKEGVVLISNFNAVVYKGVKNHCIDSSLDEEIKENVEYHLTIKDNVLQLVRKNLSKNKNFELPIGCMKDLLKRDFWAKNSDILQYKNKNILAYSEVHSIDDYVKRANYLIENRELYTNLAKAWKLYMNDYRAEVERTNAVKIFLKVLS